MAENINDPVQNKQLLGSILLERKMITQAQLDEALAIQKKAGGFLGEILVKRGLLDERDIVAALVVQCGLPYIAINKYQLDPKLLGLIPSPVAKKFQVIPLDRVGDILSVVMVSPLSVSTTEELERLTGCKIVTFITTRSEIDQAIERWYENKK